MFKATELHQIQSDSFHHSICWHSSMTCLRTQTWK